jgi:alpha-tubulin suppressor-like RCC1 family protein
VLAAGGAHACAAISSAIYCWGKNSAGELALAPATNGTPTRVITAGPTIYSIALGDRHMCFNELNANGNVDVQCYGASDRGQVGVADGVDHPVGVTVPMLSGRLHLEANGDTTCATLLTNAFSTAGHLSCWGSNSHGQLGRGSTAPFSPTPVTVCSANANCDYVFDFTVGFDHVCGAFSDGSNAGVTAATSSSASSAPTSPRPAPS